MPTPIRAVRSRAEVEYVTSQWLVRKSTTGEGQSTTLRQPAKDSGDKETVTNKKKDYAMVLDKQRKFSDEFEIDGWENTFGHFALPQPPSAIYSTVSAPASRVTKSRRPTSSKTNTAKQLAGKGSILASVVDTGFYKQSGKEVDDAFVKTRKPKYVHWVTLKDVTEEGNYYKMKIWTWGQQWDAKVKKDVIDTYIHSLVVAEIA